MEVCSAGPSVKTSSSKLLAIKHRLTLDLSWIYAAFLFNRQTGRDETWRRSDIKCRMHKISQGQVCIIRAVYVWHCVTLQREEILLTRSNTWKCHSVYLYKPVCLRHNHVIVVKSIFLQTEEEAWNWRILWQTLLCICHHNNYTHEIRNPTTEKWDVSQINLKLFALFFIVF